MLSESSQDGSDRGKTRTENDVVPAFLLVPTPSSSSGQECDLSMYLSTVPVPVRCEKRQNIY